MRDPEQDYLDFEPGNAFHQLIGTSIHLCRLFLDGPPAGIYGGIQVSPAFGIRIGDGNPPESRSPDFMRCLSFRPLRVIQ